MDSEEEQQCFAEHVACLDAPNGIVLFLVSEAALHYRGPEGPDNPSRFLEASGFFFGPWAFSDETGRYAFFRTHGAVGIVGVYGVGTDTFDFDPRERFLIFNALPKANAIFINYYFSAVSSFPIPNKVSILYFWRIAAK